MDENMTLYINKYFKIELKLDTGAEVNILPLSILNRLK